MAEPRSAPTSRRWPAIAAIGALFAVSLAAGASAQLEAGDQTVDTGTTPTAKTTTAWAQVAGAQKGVDKFPEGFTTVETELYTVAFEDSSHGFAGGMQCKVPPPADTRGAELDAYLLDCGGQGREPVIYEYIKSETDEVWIRALEGPGDGYVGAIAFLPGGRALAVGGTGEYPKREKEAVTTAANDIAGDARAWLYDGTVWVELDVPDEMRGLSAVAIAGRVGDCPEAKSVCGLAGGYRQLWMWKDTGFETGWGTTGEGTADDPEVPLTGTIDDVRSFRFRVRGIAFTNTAGVAASKAIAVTSGCCDAVAARNVASALAYNAGNVIVKEFGAPTSNNPPSAAPGDDPAVNRELAESFYDVQAGFGTSAFLASPGGSSPPVDGVGQAASRVYKTMNTPSSSTAFGWPPSTSPSVPLVSSIHLKGTAGQSGAQRGAIDWAVGERGDGQAVAYYAPSDEGLPAPATINVLTCPGGGFPWTGGTVNTQPELSCRQYDVPNGYLQQVASDFLFELPSYGLNDIAYTDATNSVAWAVGDRGALLRLGGVGTTSTVGSAPAPPKLGAASIARFAGSEVYDAFRPMPTDGDTAPVPSLSSNGTTHSDQPELVPGGSPNPTLRANATYPVEDITSVAMSRDGSAGWAVGAGDDRFNPLARGGGFPVPTVYHYDGVRWSRCDIRGISNVLPADPACAQLEGLYTRSATPSLKNILLRHVVRIPLENDDDPSNNDEFEALAVGSVITPTGEAGVTNPPVIARYQRGGWAIDEEAQRQWSKLGFPRVGDVSSIAFTAPNDGWVTIADKPNAVIGHFGPDPDDPDKARWWDCGLDAKSRRACGDTAGRLPVGQGAASSNPARLTTAGRRVYAAINRAEGANQAAIAGSGYPAIFYRDPGGEWTAQYDPLCNGEPACPDPTPSTELRGRISAIAVSENAEHGWAIGNFGADAAQDQVRQVTPDGTPSEVRGSQYYLLRLRNGEWTKYDGDDASLDYLAPVGANRFWRAAILDEDTGAAAAYASDDDLTRGPSVLLFDPARKPDGRWRVLQTPYHTRDTPDAQSSALTRAFAPDGNGGAWLAARQGLSTSGEKEALHFWHYTNDVPNAVFEEAPHPVREQITGGTAGRDGSFWVTTNSSFVYRYDRLTGWDRLRIPGWDPGRVITKTSEANAIAVGPDGDGLVVGKNGRLAQVSPLGVELDSGAGKTSRDLRAVAVSPTGTALAGGDASSLLYRRADGQWEQVDFGGAENASITAISMPSSDRAWFANTAGQVYGGTYDGAEWSFSVENLVGGKLPSIDETGALLRLNGIQIDKDGEGYAVGTRGLILERRSDGTWQRLKTAFLDDLRSITLAPGGRDRGALIGGDMGLILTLEDGEFRVAREADLFNPLNFGRGASDSGRVVGVAMVPGLKAGDVEAWAVQQVAQQAEGRAGPGTVLHYSSDPDEPLLRPGGRIDPLPDTPEPIEGEISFAAFGRSECQSARPKCAEGHAANLFNEVVSRRVTKEILERSARPGGPGFAVFTGDVGKAAGREEAGSQTNTSLDKSWVHRRWVELVADRFDDAKVPLFGAVGLNDLDRTAVCTSAGSCSVNSTGQAAGAGLAFGWRKAMAGMGWGTEDDTSERAGLEFKPVADSSDLSQGVEGEARTHYAVDVLRDSNPIARLIVLDNSMRALNASDPNQNPVEPDGQLRWLERMLAGVQRDRGQQAIVTMNTPTYSYAAGDPTTWATDAAEIERTLMSHEAKMVVSGRLGWNGRYWATAPGVHHPCPEAGYVHDNAAPDPSQPPCSDETAAADDAATRVRDRLADAMQDLGAPAPPGEDDVGELTSVTDDAGGLVQGLLPQVVAASAGGMFGPSGNEGGPAGSGWWHGYTIIRMHKDGDPRKTIVEQRPIFDWVSITGATHVLKPRQRITLIGEGREPVGADVPARYDRINSNAITHRYDLVMADEKNPSMPRRDENGDYVKVPTSVGFVNSETGQVTAGAGRQERTFTVAILSVGDKAASWPIAFEPAKSFKPRPVPVAQSSVVQTPPRPVPARPTPPPPVVLNSPPAPTPPPTPPANIPQVTLPTLKLPSPPALPNIPSLPTGTPTPAPPPPVSPPAPPGNAGALPLTLEAPITPISIVPTVIPPAPPPVNPAPPSGGAARKEARQRQAATAKSEEGGGDQGAGEGQSAGESGGSSEMTRRDRTRPAPSFDSYRRDDTRYSFTAASHTEQASAWSRGALYGGMSIATALVLALGWGIARPTPKRRHPPRPAPETVRERPRR